MFKTVAAMKLAMTLALAPFGLTPAWCESCGEMWLDYELETHVFEEVHEFDHGFETVCEELDICPICVEWYELERVEHMYE